MTMFATLLVMLAAQMTHAEDPPAACVPADQFRIEGIGPGDDLERMKSLGVILATEPYQGEDDGGQYRGVLQQYALVEVNYQEQRGVERVATTSRDASLPSSIRIGMPMTQVGDRLRFSTQWLTHGSPIVLPVCGGHPSAEVHLHFRSTPAPELSKVELIQYGP